MRITKLGAGNKTGRPRGRTVGEPPSKVAEVKSALQLSGVYGRVIDRGRITLPRVSIQHPGEPVQPLAHYQQGEPE